MWFKVLLDCRSECRFIFSQHYATGVSHSFGFLVRNVLRSYEILAGYTNHLFGGVGMLVVKLVLIIYGWVVTLMGVLALLSGHTLKYTDIRSIDFHVN